VAVVNPLLFADWRSIANTFTLLCWVAVLVLVFVILLTIDSHAPSQAHRSAMVAHWQFRRP
jgi:hypothetical protein